ncbi:hypothetical protein ILYODFUR_038360 [Ilyodon furcidens]|uniref:Uncharacterized protein n=1 Tax=Ilyodon furcidens TaxID=33524 RepID=A0ABV0TS31_9TELE
MVMGGVVHRGVCLTARLARWSVFASLWEQGVHVPILAWSLHLGGPAVLGQVQFGGGLGVGVGCILLPCLPGCGCCLVPGFGGWALCWLCPLGSGVAWRACHVTSFVWRILVVLGCSAPLFGLGKWGCLLGSAGELAPWESGLPPSPSLPILGHLPLPPPSQYHSWRGLGCRGAIGVPQGFSISAVPWQPVPQFYCTT